MYYIESDLSAEDYLAALKRTFGSVLAFADERITGVVVGPFFSVAHHCEFEWNRRITSECNRAMGFVRNKDGVTEVHYIRSKGSLSAFWLILYTVVPMVFLWFIAWRNQLDPLDPFLLIISVLFSLFVCGISAVHDSITERGQDGAREIYKLLLWPDKYV